MSTSGNHPSRPNEPVPRPDRKPFHFLIADDSPVNRKILRIVLERYGDSVDEAENGLEAVEMALLQHYDALFLDIHMPKMDGMEAMAVIRALGDDRAMIPIFAVTGDTRWEDRKKYLALGADGFIGKPIHIEELDAELDRVMAHKSEPKISRTG